ncbi:uncharacterized protein LOC143675912 [Tamandua tetradactyla]|uniref:uncharacterized protein LOC143675912 n=1 Tax=Tamandua tetradactyla TaxID=48850 RepID=UPI004054859A
MKGPGARARDPDPVQPLDHHAPGIGSCLQPALCPLPPAPWEDFPVPVITYLLCTHSWPWPSIPITLQHLHLLRLLQGQAPARGPAELGLGAGPDLGPNLDLGTDPTLPTTKPPALGPEWTAAVWPACSLGGKWRWPKRVLLALVQEGCRDAAPWTWLPYLPRQEQGRRRHPASQDLPSGVGADLRAGPRYWSYTDPRGLRGNRKRCQGPAHICQQGTGAQEKSSRPVAAAAECGPRGGCGSGQQTSVSLLSPGERPEGELGAARGLVGGPLGPRQPHRHQGRARPRQNEGATQDPGGLMWGGEARDFPLAVQTPAIGASRRLGQGRLAFPRAPFSLGSCAGTFCLRTTGLQV